MVQLQSKTKAIAERLVSYGADFEAFNVIPELKGQRFALKTLAGEYTDLFMPLYGEHQTENAALAVAAVEAFLGNGERRILDDIVRVSFADIASPGRLQVVSREPMTIVDGAHNPHGVRSLAKALKNSFGAPRSVGVVGILNGKNVDEMLETLSGSFERVIITASKSDRSVDKEELANMATKYWDADSITVSSSVTKAIQDARELLSEKDLEAIVITGSLSVVGEALVTVQEENNED
jgi:dihydrofolate synthase/folylpolyglutamate synthase